MKAILLPALAAATLLCVGCIHTEETVTRDEPRVPVAFETETAGRVFYEALSRMSGGGGSHRESSTNIEVPLVFEHRTKTVRGPNTAFNEAVARADTNRDGKITETEANIFASQVK
ncbi:MAG TPA: hypothetical protein VMB21_17455 [Candidatus Limnocylindria bacterium]|nr:hypothetical protein [Candidatus Limnocylindria bacterium]